VAARVPPRRRHRHAACFDRTSLREHRFLVLGLPPLVLLGTVSAAWGLGEWSITTTYFYWQWFHYTRQSYGIAQVYRRKSGGLASEREHLSRLAFYLVPLWGILHRSAQEPGLFLGLPLRVLPVTRWSSARRPWRDSAGGRCSGSAPGRRGAFPSRTRSTSPPII
jgi:hypothetical protein